MRAGYTGGGSTLIINEPSAAAKWESRVLIIERLTVCLHKARLSTGDPRSLTDVFNCCLRMIWRSVEMDASGNDLWPLMAQTFHRHSFPFARSCLEGGAGGGAFKII